MRARINQDRSPSDIEYNQTDFDEGVVYYKPKENRHQDAKPHRKYPKNYRDQVTDRMVEAEREHR